MRVALLRSLCFIFFSRSFLLLFGAQFDDELVQPSWLGIVNCLLRFFFFFFSLFSVRRLHSPAREVLAILQCLRPSRFDSRQWKVAVFSAGVLDGSFTSTFLIVRRQVSVPVRAITVQVIGDEWCFLQCQREIPRRDFPNNLPLLTAFRVRKPKDHRSRELKNGRERPTYPRDGKK